MTETERLTAELAELRAARLAFLTGGAVKRAKSGRFGNEMGYDNPTLADFDKAIEDCLRDLSAEQAIESGLSGRGHTQIYWQH